MVVYQMKRYAHKVGRSHPVFYFTGRDQQGNFRMFSTWDERLRPRFMVKRSHLDETIKQYSILNDYILHHEDCSVPSIYHERLSTIYTRIPSDVSSIRNYFPVTYESDILWEDMARREIGIGEYFEVQDASPTNFVSMDNIRTVEPPGWVVPDRECIFDIETHSPNVKGVPRYHDAKSGLVTIIIISAFDTYTKTNHVFRIGDTPLPIKTYENPLPEKFKILSRTEDTYPIIEHLFTSQRDLLRAFVDWCGECKFDTYMGHNISGGNIVRGKHREWLNGFDFNTILGCCEHEKIDPSRLSTLGYAKLNLQGSKEKVVIKSNLVADWLYWWIYSHYGDSLIKVDVDGRIHKLRNNKLGSITNVTYGVSKLTPKCGLLDASNPADLTGLQIGDQYARAPHYTTLYCVHDTMLVWFNELVYNVVHDLSKIPIAAMGLPQNAIYAQKYTDDYTRMLTKGQYVLPTKTYSKSHDRPGFDIYGHRIYKYPWDDDVSVMVGGYVPDAVVGSHVDIGCADFSKQYPSMSQTLNEGIDTRIYNPTLSLRKDGLWIVDCRKGDDDYYQDIPWEFKWEDVVKVPCYPEVHNKHGRVFDRMLSLKKEAIVFFRQDFTSVESKAYDRLKRTRKSVQQEMTQYEDGTTQYLTCNGHQRALKYMTNGRNGVKANKGYRLGSPKNYNAIVCACRFITRHIQAYMRDYPTVQGDTDSIFPKFVNGLSDTEREKLESIMNDEIDRYVRSEFHCKQNFMEIGFEKLMSRFYSIAKKKYIGEMVWTADDGWLETPRLVWRGIELRKKNTSVYMDRMWMDFSNILLSGKDIQIETVAYFNRVKGAFFKAPATMIGTMAYLSKNVDEYGDIPRARAARTALHLFGKRYERDDDFYLVYLKSLPITTPYDLRKNDPVVAVNENTPLDGLEIDYEKHWKECVNMMKPILKMIGVKMIDLGGRPSVGAAW